MSLRASSIRPSGAPARASGAVRYGTFRRSRTCLIRYALFATSDLAIDMSWGPGQGSATPPVVWTQSAERTDGDRSAAAKPEQADASVLGVIL
jgi:hypothetical protein